MCWGRFVSPVVWGGPLNVNAIKQIKIKQQIKDLADELKRVDWPTREKVVSSTWAVVMVSAFVGAFLYGSDLLISWGMKLIMPH